MIFINILSYIFLGDKVKVYVNKPYPKIKISKKDTSLAKLLTHAYASNEGELTAIHLYAYQSMILRKNNEEIANILLEISKTEMHHLYLLGNTINELGCQPIFADTNYNLETYWTSFDVYYDTDIKTILEIDIESEKEAIHNYQLILNNINDIYVKELIARILEDEQVHLEVFTKLYHKISDN